MSRLVPLPSRDVISKLKRSGFVHVRTKGSHASFRKEREGGATLTVIVALNQNSIPVGTLQSIIRQAGLTRDEFLDL